LRDLLLEPIKGEGGSPQERNKERTRRERRIGKPPNNGGTTRRTYRFTSRSSYNSSYSNRMPWDLLMHPLLNLYYIVQILGILNPSLEHL
jgi:hypothetical protein